MGETLIKVESRGAVRLLTIDRPEALNALNEALLRELDASLDALEADTSARAAVITGAGDRSFVAGGDIKAMRRFSALEAEAFSRLGQKVMDHIGSLPQPVIAAVNGFALGGGLELALACDFIYASGRAVLGLVEADLGLLPGFGGIGRLVRRIGDARAREAILTAHRFSAAEALAVGLVNRVCPPESLVSEALTTAESIAAKDPVATALTKSLIETTRTMGQRTADALERRSFALLFSGEGAQAGMAAFLEKRPPVFRGR